MAKLTLERSVVELEIADMKFEVSLNDKELLEFQNKYKQVAKEMKEIQKNRAEDEDPIQIYADINKSLNAIYDSLLGEGAYEKLYAYNGSVSALAELLLDISEAVNNEISNKTSASEKKLARYTTKPNDHKKKAKKWVNSKH